MSTTTVSYPLAQLDYPTTDVERCVSFFSSVLEVPLLFRAGPLAFLDLGGIRLYVRPAHDEADVQRASVLYLRTQHLEEALQEVLVRGAVVHERPKMIADMRTYELWMAFIKDPDGRLIGLMEERAKTPDAN